MICIQGVWAQSLMHSKPLDYNAGFAGSKKYDRISFHLNEFSNQSRNSYFSYDKLVKPLKGGIGFYGNRKSIKTVDFEERTHDVTKIGAVYSPKFIVKNSILISPSLGLEYSYYALQSIRFLDETTSQRVETSEHNIVSVKPGILVNTKKGYFGYTIHNQFFNGLNNLHSFQTGYVFQLDKKINIIVDGRYNHGVIVDNFWRNYTSQLNLAYQYGVLFVGAGLNDQKFVSGLFGLKLINLKVNVAYHVLNPQNLSNVELGVQYVFNKYNKEKLELPFRKWLLKLRM